MMSNKEPTVTEKWIAAVQAERASAIRSGQYFDGQEHGNVLSFNERRQAPECARTSLWDELPSDCNPD